jgi:hypothetical protein
MLNVAGKICAASWLSYPSRIEKATIASLSNDVWIAVNKLMVSSSLKDDSCQAKTC